MDERVNDMLGVYVLVAIGLLVYLVCFCVAAFLIFGIVMEIIDKVCDTVIRLHELRRGEK